MNNPYESMRFGLSPKEIFIHDHWNPETTNYDADISLLEFEEGSIHFNDYVQPVCLWKFGTEPVENEGIVTGWGKSEDRTKFHENIPKLISAPMQSNEQCFFETQALLGLSSKRTFCAGLKNGSGVCNGDSGGGFFIKVNQVFYLKGIVSSSLVRDGRECDVSRNAVYTNVPKFYNWIDKITKGTLVFSSQGKLAKIMRT